MTVRTNANFEQAEEEGRTELVLAAVTYTGDRSMYQSEALRTNGGYPALDGFQRGETKLVKLPSGSLGWWERHSSFDIAYDEKTIAQALLDKNYLPQQIVGPGFDPNLRNELLDKLGMDPATDEEGYREQLRGVAGVDPEDDEQPDEPDRRVQYLTGNVDRSVLIKVANSYDDIDGYLDEAGKENVSHLGQTEVAEFLDQKDDDAVDRRIEKAEMGQDL